MEQGLGFCKRLNDTLCGLDTYGSEVSSNESKVVSQIAENKFCNEGRKSKLSCRSKRLV